MHHLFRIAAGLVIGSICGATIGAVMLAVPTYFENGCGPLGCVRDWTRLAIYMGSMFGGIPGAAIGLIISVASSNRHRSVAIGALIGLLIAIILFGMGAAGDALVSIWAILSIPGGALVGLIVKEALGFAGISRNRQYQ